MNIFSNRRSKETDVTVDGETVETSLTEALVIALNEFEEDQLPFGPEDLGFEAMIQVLENLRKLPADPVEIVRKVFDNRAEVDLEKHKVSKELDSRLEDGSRLRLEVGWSGNEKSLTIYKNGDREGSWWHPGLLEVSLVNYETLGDVAYASFRDRRNGVEHPFGSRAIYAKVVTSGLWSVRK